MVKLGNEGAFATAEAIKGNHSIIYIGFNSDGNDVGRETII